MDRTSKIINDWFKLIAEEERKLDESHMRTVKLHKEIMQDIERIKDRKQVNLLG